MTDLTMERNLLYNVSGAEQRLQRLQDMASSGKVFQRPQDDPVGVERAVALRDHAAKNNVYLRNLDKAKAWLENTEQALSELTTVLNRAKEIGMEGTNGTTPPDARVAIASEVHQLWEEVGNIANRQIEGRLIIQGTMPTWRVAPATEITSEDLTALLGDIKDRLSELESGLKDPSMIDPKAVLDDLDRLTDAVLAQRAANGARVNRVETLVSKMTDLDIEFQRQLSNLEDADITEVIVRLRSAEAAYQAALGAGAKLIQPSLLDYLR